MTRFKTNFVICSFALCATFLHPETGKAQDLLPVPLVQQKLIVNNTPFGEIITDSEVFISSLKVFEGLDTSGGLVGMSQRNRPFEPMLRGIGGAFLDTALKQLFTLDDEFLVALDAGQAEVLSYISGRIVSWEFTPGGTDDEGLQRGSGQIVVETFLTTVPIPTVPPAVTMQANTTALRWTIDIVDDGFVVEPRATPTSNFTDQPFPKAARTIPDGGAAIVFPPTTIAHANDRGFDTKLWAVGDKVVVTRLERAENWPVNTVYTDLSPADFDLYFDQGPDTCIDLMLKVDGGDVPTDTGGLLGPRNYCLGRCGDPNIVNTP